MTYDQWKTTDPAQDRAPTPNGVSAPQGHTGQEKALTEAQIESLLRIADAVVTDWAESGGESDMFDTLEALALIVPVEGGFDPDRHEGPFTDFLERGDDYYEPAPWLVAAINRMNNRAKAAP